MQICITISSPFDADRFAVCVVFYILINNSTIARGSASEKREKLAKILLVDMCGNLARRFILW